MRKERQRLKSCEKEEKKGLFARNNVIRKLKLVLELVLRWTILNLKEKKKKQDRTMLIAIVKEQQRRIQEAMG